MEFAGFHSQEYKPIDWNDYEGKPQVLSKEMSKRKYVVEGFADVGAVNDNTANWLPHTPAPTPYDNGSVISSNAGNITVNWLPPIGTTSPPDGTPVPTTAPPFYTVATAENLDKNLLTIQHLEENNAETNQLMMFQYMDLSENIGTYIDKSNYLVANNDKYHFVGRDDPNVILHPEESKDIQSALQNDVIEMKLYQNSMYITSAIACATLLIGAIIISK